MAACIYIPNKKGTEEPSQLFLDLLDLTSNDRETTKFIWALSQDSALMTALGLSSEEEPSATDLLRALKLADKILDADGYAKYVTEKENLNNEIYDTYGEAHSIVQDLSSDYPNLVPIISETEGGFKVTLVKDTLDNRKIQARQQAQRTLNTKLIHYMGRLGFGVQEVDGLESPGVFSPLNAEENAEGLKMAIRVSKSTTGQEVLPEEFSHLLVAGFRTNPFMQRLLDRLQDPEIVEAILGEEYDSYDEKYNGNLELLAEEAAARLIAQNLVDRAGIESSISFISNKALDAVQNNLSKGSEEYIDQLIREANQAASSVIDNIIEDEDAIQWFDKSAVMNSSTLYHLDVKAKNLEQIVTKAYETLSKRAKILSLSRKDGKLRPEDAQAFTKLKANIEKKKYAAGCLGFLNYVLKDCEDLYESLDNIRDKFKKGGDDRQLRAAFRTLRSIESALEAYTDTVKTLSSVTSNDEVMEELSEEDVESIEGLSKEVLGVLSNLNTLHDDMRKNSLFKFYQRYWGKDKIIKAANGEDKTLTLEDVLESSLGDISGFSRIVNSMADMADPLMQMVDMAYKDATNTRDAQIFTLQQKLAILQKRYTEATGSRDTSWMYVKDENGKPTGMLISDRDFNKYYKERSEYYQSLKDEGLEQKKISAKLQAWDRNHSEPVDVGYGRKELLPRKSMYPSDALDKLSSAQKDYYNQFMEIKKGLDSLIPNRNAHLYRAPQKKISTKDAILHKGKLSTIFKRFKDRYVKSVDDTEYGEDVLDASGKHVILDFGGKEVKKIPVYYTTWLDDMSLLDTNATDALLSYGAMAYNYTAMHSIADVLEVTNSLMQDRKIIQTSGKRKLFERFKLRDETFTGDYTIPGAASSLAKKLRNYIDSNVYDRRKEKEIWTVGNTEINVGKLGDELKRYGSVVGLGYNLFSGMTNVSMGVAQTLLQAVGGEYFGLKNLAKAHKWYNKDLAPSIAEQYNDIKKNKLSLLMQKFDALEEYYQELDSSSYNSGVFKKLLGKHNPLIFNSMGEHYLHAISMLAYLDNNKVEVGGKETSLYDALTPAENTDGTYELVFADGARDSEGNRLLDKSLKQELKELSAKKYTEMTEKEKERYNELVEISNRTDDLLFKTKLAIQQVNHSMHGAFNATDRGDIHRNVIGRLAMQFRQWMPAFYTERFKGRRYNMITEREEEGFYVTAAKFTLGTLKDMAKLKFNILTRWKTLSPAEKSNIKKAIFEVALLYAIGLVLHGTGGPDKEDPWIANMMKYNLYRLKMELGAAAPTSLAFLGNVKTLIQSPVPVMENLDRIISLIDLSTMGDTIESGKYAGWNRWLKNLYFATPYVKNVSRFVDLVEGDTSMFTPYINTRKY